MKDVRSRSRTPVEFQEGPTAMQTLVLAPSYEPVACCTWQRAVTLLFRERVEVVESYTGKEIHSVSFSMPVPAVVRFVRGKFGRRSIRFSRENVYARDNGNCAYCARHIPRAEATYDHVVPRSQGGQTSFGNIVLCCYKCNAHKAARTPEQADMRLLVKPGRPTTAPDILRATMSFGHDAVPVEWRQVLLDWGYWKGKLDETP